MDNFSFSMIDFGALISEVTLMGTRANEEESEAINVLTDCFVSIKNNIEYWEAHCLFTKTKYGKHLLNAMEHIKSKDIGSNIKTMLMSVFAFYEECRYWSNDSHFNTNDLGVNYQRLISLSRRHEVYRNSLESLFDDIKIEVPRETIRHKVKDDAFSKIFNEVNDRDYILNKVGNLGALIESKTELVEALDKKISELRTEYNFIGLYKGFRNVYDKKEIARKNAVKFSYLLGAALISVPFLVIVLGMYMQYKELLDLILLQFIAIPVISAEVFLFYYFRLKYLEVKSFDAQLLQLDLRMALCQFVESYSKFAVEIRKESPDILSNFEALVFSPIVAKESDIPPLVDGASQLIELLSKVRK